jgi:hypothetical protein
MDEQYTLSQREQECATSVHVSCISTSLPDVLTTAGTAAQMQDFKAILRNLM